MPDTLTKENTLTDTITLTGLVVTAPTHVVATNGLAITTFRLVSASRRYDRINHEWVDGDTNWYTIVCFRQLATNVIQSVLRGQRVVLTGNLRIRDWATEDTAGVAIEVDASAIGHDLSWGTAAFTRGLVEVGATAQQDERAEQDPDPSDVEAAAQSEHPDAGPVPE